MTHCAYLHPIIAHFHILFSNFWLKNVCLVVSPSSLHRLYNVFPIVTPLLARFTFVGILSRNSLYLRYCALGVVYRPQSILNTCLFFPAMLFCSIIYTNLIEKTPSPSSLHNLLSTFSICRVCLASICIRSTSILASQTNISLLWGIFLTPYSLNLVIHFFTVFCF